ncbi:MAG: hypothetical protein KAX13_09935, partial [Candidatus Krumholzibacteria bacterium]|nr:hypothetical protein [Candidatus Krumholzibacteria bacterium]
MKRQTVLIFSLALVVLLIAGFRFYNYLPDDTFITLRYVKNVTRGEGFVFNSGERVEGYTNFLWLILLATAGKTGLPVVMTARTLSFAFTLVTLLLSGFAVRDSARKIGYDT